MKMTGGSKPTSVVPVSTDEGDVYHATPTIPSTSVGGGGGGGGDGTKTTTTTTTQQRWKHWYEWCPIINLGYEFLFDEPPSFETLEKTLNLLGLVVGDGAS